MFVKSSTNIICYVCIAIISQYLLKIKQLTILNSQSILIISYVDTRTIKRYSFHSLVENIEEGTNT